ncbi:MAG: alpha/beta fold hydrolase [Phycisphaerales bacterium]|nr:alpha/beta fold hydrolase [Phycisphaerales bacterium]
MQKLLVTIFMILSVTQLHAQSDQQLVDRYDKMYAAEKYELALKSAKTICERYPESARWNFFAGALYAKLGQPETAIQHLEICAQNNYTGIASFEQNTDLDSIRDRDDFKRILEQVRTAAQARMDEFQQEAKRHKPMSYYPDQSNDTSSKPPLIIALHGTGMIGQSMFNAIKQTAEKQGAILICPDALRPSGEGFAWTYRDESSWFVNYLIQDAVENHNADPDQVILIGFSQGANIALILGQTQPETFLAVVPICGHYEEQNAKSTTTPAPFYLMSGARDPWKKTYVKAKRDFTSSGGSVQTRILAGKGHELPTGQSGNKEYAKAIIWAKKHLNED